MSKRTKTQELENLLQESLPFVVLRSESGDHMSTDEYRQSLISVRSRYNPRLRDRISSIVPELEDDRLRGALLKFLTTEIMDYLHEGRLHRLEIFSGHIVPEEPRSTWSCVISFAGPSPTEQQPLPKHSPIV